MNGQPLPSINFSFRVGLLKNTAPPALETLQGLVPKRITIRNKKTYCKYWLISSYLGEKILSNPQEYCHVLLQMLIHSFKELQGFHCVPVSYKGHVNTSAIHRTKSVIISSWFFLVQKPDLNSLYVF